MLGVILCSCFQPSSTLVCGLLAKDYCFQVWNKDSPKAGTAQWVSTSLVSVKAARPHIHAPTPPCMPECDPSGSTVWDPGVQPSVQAPQPSACDPVTTETTIKRRGVRGFWLARRKNAGAATDWRQTGGLDCLGLLSLPLSWGMDASSSTAPRGSSWLAWPQGWGDARGTEGELVRLPGSSRSRG